MRGAGALLLTAFLRAVAVGASGVLAAIYLGSVGVEPPAASRVVSAGLAGAAVRRGGRLDAHRARRLRARLPLRDPALRAPPRCPRGAARAPAARALLRREPPDHGASGGAGRARRDGQRDPHDGAPGVLPL